MTKVKIINKKLLRNILKKAFHNRRASRVRSFSENITANSKIVEIKWLQMD
jgi:hypothetical protein